MILDYFEAFPAFNVPHLYQVFRPLLFLLALTFTTIVASDIWLNKKKKAVPGKASQTHLSATLTTVKSSQEIKLTEGDDDSPNSDDTDDGDEAPPAMQESYERIPFKYERKSEKEMERVSKEFFEVMSKRRTIRKFSTEPIPKAVIENLIKTAGSSPSGANAQPWTYVVVSDQKTKEEIRRIVELEEQINYERRMGKQWVNDLKPFNLNWEKPYLTEAPHLILVFKQVHSYDPKTGKKRHHYYQEISTSLSVGILLAAIQVSGLVTLTSTPLNCGPGLRTLLKRPEQEKLILLLPVGYPSADATVPNLERKELNEIMVSI